MENKIASGDSLLFLRISAKAMKKPEEEASGVGRIRRRRHHRRRTTFPARLSQRADCDRANPVVGKSLAQCPQLGVDASIRSVSYGAKPNLSAQVSSVGTESDKVSATLKQEVEDAVTEARDSKVFGGGGGSVAGILYKWVNYGKGWRSRWFALEDGVLSYYKVHGPDKILMSPAREKGLRVIGGDSLRYMRKANWGSSNRLGASAKPCKPFGVVHLKVSSIRASKSDDKRLSIFTGTKTLHLRCVTREDRAVWIEALLASKDLFPRVLTSCDFGPSEDVVVSTEKLRSRLVQEGIGEAVIKDCESIMLSKNWIAIMPKLCKHEILANELY